MHEANEQVFGSEHTRASLAVIRLCSSDKRMYFRIVTRSSGASCTRHIAPRYFLSDTG